MLHLAPHRSFARTGVLLLASLAAGSGLLGCEASKGPRTASTSQQIHAGATKDGQVVVGVDVLVTDDSGQGVACGDGTVEMTLEISRNGQAGPWVQIERSEYDTSCRDQSAGDLALVMDNSGSEATKIDLIRAGAQRAVERVLAQGGRASLVRVSTNSQLLSPLTAEPAQLGAAVGELHVHRGWTALWDGVRMGHETLGAGDDGAELVEQDGARAFCANSRRRGVLLFTDGEENNSSGQSLLDADYPGDGLDTSLEDLEQLNVSGGRTPIYADGVGKRIDAAALSSLAESSGGRFVQLDDLSQLDVVLGDIADYFASGTRFCSPIPSHLCGQLEVRASHRWTNGHVETSGQSQVHLAVPCPVRAQGRVATLLMTPKSTDASTATLDRLVANTVNWVSPVDAPKVLFVLDDFHHGEVSEDTHELYARLASAGYAADYLEEPTQGLTPELVAGYDVVWFSNPGYPMDDYGTFNTLLQFSSAGGGVILQGDDMSYSQGNAFSMTPLTHLVNVDNGTSYCGRNIDNGRGGRYLVTLGSTQHPVLADLQGESFLYGDDIDTAKAASDAQVLAWATVQGVSKCPDKPVIVGWTPEAAP